jgi:hypothetical protein
MIRKPTDPTPFSPRDSQGSYQSAEQGDYKRSIYFLHSNYSNSNYDYALGASAGLSVDGAEVLRRSPQPPRQVPERPWRALRELGLAQSTATGGAHHGW